MKRIITILITCLFLAVAAAIFVTDNFSTNKKIDRNFIVIHGQGNGLYPFRQTFNKGTRAINVVHELEDRISDPKYIYIKEHNKWRKVEYDYKIYIDTTIKIEY